MNKKMTDYNEGVIGLLEHVEILKDNILSITSPINYNITTKDDAEIAIKEIKKLQEKICSYQNTARALRISLEREMSF